MTEGRLPASFRDPAGYVFRRGGELYRCITHRHADDYAALMASGLYEELTAAGLLIPHAEAPVELADDSNAHRVLRPEPIEFVSYPYEWCFGQLQAAALCSLEIQRRAVARGMALKDASAYNVQFRAGRPVLIDTLSLERYPDGAPWVAYRQFCEHFLAPLLLVARVDASLGRLLQTHLDGVPLGTASRLLGARAWGSAGALMHVVLHARSLRKQGAAHGARARTAVINRRRLLALLDHLEQVVRGCNWNPASTEWAEYGQSHGYGAESLAAKRQKVADWLVRCAPGVVWDLGANTGDYSRLAAAAGARVVAFDADPGAVELNYRRVVAAGETRLLPLVMDLAAPSPSLGWNLCERLSLVERGPADAVLALALVHHLAIARNLPLGMIAEFFSRLGHHLVVEFVPKDDPMARRLLAARADVFDEYRPDAFERVFARSFRVCERYPISGTSRTLYLMERQPA
ncbi:MAG TPA: hypothetical protein VFU46_00605 [Gemmatimonadales bacterium]|nr:hypothetical protein [Gemmatimonadales bacterium]